MRRDQHRYPGPGHLGWAGRRGPQKRPSAGRLGAGIRHRPSRWLRAGVGLAGLAGLAIGFGCGGEPRSLQAIEPPLGSVLGGEPVALRGSGFGDAVRVFFAGDEARVQGRDGSRLLHVQTPAVATRGEVAISALWQDGQIQTLLRAFTFHALKLSDRPRPLLPTRVVALAEIPKSPAGALGDLAVATEQPAELQLLRGQPDGRFAWTSSLPLRASPSAVISVDVDGDGRSDLVVAEASRSTLSLWMGQADGRFIAGGEQTTRCPPAALAAANLLEDGLPELIIGCQDSAAGTAPIDVLPNRWPQGPAARFGPAVSLSVSGSLPLGGTSLVIADVNGDGRSDVAATLSRRSALHIWHSDGMGGFSAAPVIATASEPLAILAADLNGDQRSDLVVSDGSGASVGAYLSQGGALGPRREYRLPAGTASTHVAAIDWDQDGRSELAVAAETAPRLQILRVGAGGQLQPSQDLAVSDAPWRLLAAAPTSAAKPALLAIQRDATALHAWPWLTSGRASDSRLSSALPLPHALVTADLSSDGRSDAAWLVGSRVALLLGDLDGLGSEGPPAPRFLDLSGPRGTPSSLVTGDLNGDWLGDLVLGDASGLQILLAQQPGQYQPAVAVELGLAIDHLALADVNDDGRPDIVAASRGQAGLLVLLGKGNGTLYEPQRIPLPAGEVEALRVIDQDGDGHRDVLALTRDHLYLLRGEGDGRLAAPQSTPLSATGSALATLDLDFDGRRDVVVASHDARRLLVLRGQPDGSLALTQSLDAPVPLDAVVAEDIDRDGLLDVAAIERGGSDLRVFLGRSDGSLLPPLTFAGSPLNAASGGQAMPIFELTAIDLSGDAERDILTVGSQGILLRLRTPFGG